MIKLYRIFLYFLAFAFLGLHAEEGEPSFVSYIKNKGQWDSRILYQADIKGGKMYLEENAFSYIFYPKEGFRVLHPHPNGKQDNPSGIYTLDFHAVRMEFEGSLPDIVTEESDRRSYYHNYYLGKNKKNWSSNVPLMGTVTYRNMYNGISIKTFSDKNNPRFDFLIEAGADVSRIKMKFIGQDKLSLREGDLIISTKVGDIMQQAPKAYQEVSGLKREVKCKYKLRENVLSFEITGNYDHSKPLIIDPTLVFATYTGSIADNWGMSAAYDQSGNGYTTGICFAITPADSASSPGIYNVTNYVITPGAFQQTFGGGVNNATYSYMFGFDIVASKFNPTGTALLYSTYLGGIDNEQPQSIIVDNNDNLVIFGRSYSSDFPVTSGAYDVSQNGGSDIIVSKFNSTGSVLLASTFVGGSSDDGVNYSGNEVTLGSLKYNYADDGRGNISLDNNNNVYISACTISTDFPVTPGCFQSANGGMQDGCVFKMDANLTTLTWSSYIGGSANDAAYSAFIDGGNNVYVTGGTESPNFPVTAGALHSSYMGNIDGFLTHISSNGTSLLQSTYIGSPAYDQSYFVQLDKYDNVYIYGQSAGPYNVTAGVYSVPNGGQFIHCFAPNLASTVFSTTFGTGKTTYGPCSTDIAPSAFLVDKCQNIYISGWGGTLFGYNIPNSTTSGLPVTSNAFQSNTDGSDFYFMALTKNAGSLWYATYFGGTGGSQEHVDGGTSRFDKNGVIYQAICESCGGYQDMPTSPGAWSSSNNSANCNNALVKFNFDLRQTVASLSMNPVSQTGCAPFIVNFGNQSTNAIDYHWDFGDGTSTTVTTPTHTYSSPGSYTVQLIAIDTTTCNMRDTVYSYINVLPPVTVVASVTLTICSADSAQLKADTTNATSVSWLPPTGLSNPNSTTPLAFPGSSTIYTVTATNGVCSAVDTVSVKAQTIAVTPTILGGDSLSLCNPDSVKLAVNSIYSSYHWNTGQTTSAIEVYHSGIYVITATDNVGCVGSDTTQVYEFFPVSSPMSDQTICEGQTVQLQEIQGNYSYNWWPTTALNHANIYNPTAHPSFTTTYTCTIKNGACTSRNTVTIHVNPLPGLIVDPTICELLPGETVTLHAYSRDSVLWSPATGLSCVNCPNPVVTTDDDITYMVVTGDPQTGCIDSEYVSVIVTGSFFVPNTFTPNYDGLNDEFKPKGTNVYDYKMIIFDRWGNHLFTTTDIDVGWNGFYKGQMCQEDVYVYKIEYSQKHTKNHQLLSGHINLVR